MKGMLREFVVDQLKVRIYRSRKEMGEAAGWTVSEKMREILKTKRPLSMVFASAPSQNEFLEALGQSLGIDWSEVTALHLDEYVGLSSEAPQSFSRFLREKLLHWNRRERALGVQRSPICGFP
jgi:glucosamine-6-phosphate deaminase